MRHRLIDRAFSLCLAATLTLAMLAGVDLLAQRAEPPLQVWAVDCSHCDVSI